MTTLNLTIDHLGEQNQKLNKFADTKFKNKGWPGSSSWRRSIPSIQYFLLILYLFVIEGLKKAQILKKYFCTSKSENLKFSIP